MDDAVNTAAQATARATASTTLRRRRIAFATLVVLGALALLGLMAALLFPQGPDPIGVAMLLLFALTLPWTAIGFWNAVIGFGLMHFARDPAGFAASPSNEDDAHALQPTRPQPAAR